MKQQQHITDKENDEEENADNNNNGIVMDSEGYDNGFDFNEEEQAIPLCSRCETFQSDKRCYNCELFFCNKCFERKHRTPPWTNHTYKDIQPQQQT